MYCSNCKKTFPNDAGYCDNCGAKLENDPNLDVQPIGNTSSTEENTDTGIESMKQTEKQADPIESVKSDTPLNQPDQTVQPNTADPTGSVSQPHPNNQYHRSDEPQPINQPRQQNRTNNANQVNSGNQTNPRNNNIGGYQPRPDNQPNFNQQSQPGYHQPPTYSSKPEAIEPVPTWKWVGIHLLNLIPIVGPIIYLVLLFVWAFGECKYPSLKNYAKAMLILMLISIILIILSVIFILPILNDWVYNSPFNGWYNFKPY